MGGDSEKIICFGWLETAAACKLGRFLYQRIDWVFTSSTAIGKDKKKIYGGSKPMGITSVMTAFLP